MWDGESWIADNSFETPMCLIYVWTEVWSFGCVPSNLARAGKERESVRNEKSAPFHSSLCIVSCAVCGKPFSRYLITKLNVMGSRRNLHKACISDIFYSKYRAVTTFFALPPIFPYFALLCSALCVTPTPLSSMLHSWSPGYFFISHPYQILTFCATKGAIYVEKSKFSESWGIGNRQFCTIWDCFFSFGK